MIADSDLSEEELVELSHFIREHGKVSPTGALGLTTAVVSAPNEVEPADWLAAIWGQPEFDDEHQAARMIKGVVALYNAVLELLQHDDLSFVPGPDAVDLVEEFCQGYLKGVQLAPDWKRDRRAMILPAILGVLSGEVPARTALAEPVDDVDAWVASHREGLRNYVAALYHRFEAGSGRMH